MIIESTLSPKEKRKRSENVWRTTSFHSTGSVRNRKSALTSADTRSPPLSLPLSRSFRGVGLSVKSFDKAFQPEETRPSILPPSPMISRFSYDKPSINPIANIPLRTNLYLTNRDILHNNPQFSESLNLIFKKKKKGELSFPTQSFQKDKKKYQKKEREREKQRNLFDCSPRSKLISKLRGNVIRIGEILFKNSIRNGNIWRFRSTLLVFFPSFFFFPTRN